MFPAAGRGSLIMMRLSNMVLTKYFGTDALNR